jgi:myo-inositol-1(or 4)-monophosphatase
MDYAEPILEMLRTCAPIALRFFGRADRAGARTKPGDRAQVVTDADVEIGRTIAAAVAARFPDHNLIDEEIGVVDRGSRFTWVVDPIDGTSNFAAGVPTYGIMIGLLSEGRPIACGIALPAFDETYWAEAGKGAWRDGTRIAVDDVSDLSTMLVACGVDGHPADPERTRAEFRALAAIADSVRNVRSSNSVYDAVLLAQGKYGGWLLHESRIWDNVAPHLLIEEAGGRYTRLDGSQLDYERPLLRARENFAICAAPPAVHERLQAILRRA